MDENIIPFLGVKLSELPLEMQDYLTEMKERWQLDEDSGEHARIENHIKQEVAAYMPETRESVYDEKD